MLDWPANALYTYKHVHNTVSTMELTLWLTCCRYKVQAYFSGHEHDLQYHHLAGETTHYIVSGAGSLTDYPATYYPSPRSRFLHQGSGERPS